MSTVTFYSTGKFYFAYFYYKLYFWVHASSLHILLLRVRDRMVPVAACPHHALSALCVAMGELLLTCSHEPHMPYSKFRSKVKFLILLWFFFPSVLINDAKIVSRGNIDWGTALQYHLGRLQSNENVRRIQFQSWVCCWSARFSLRRSFTSSGLESPEILN